jgi:hypothetical protein
MRTFLVTILAFILTLTTLSFAGQVDDQLNGSNINFETIEKLPRTDLEINFPNASKAKLNVDLISQPTFCYVLIDYQKEISPVPRYHLPNYNILRSKNYFLII